MVTVLVKRGDDFATVVLPKPHTFKAQVTEASSTEFNQELQQLLKDLAAFYVPHCIVKEAPANFGKALVALCNAADQIGASVFLQRKRLMIVPYQDDV